MNTLWTFGDSYTFGHGCRPDGPLTEYYNNYKKDGDDVWPNLLGELMNIKVKNFGKCGASNDFIIDSIIDNYDDINENDFVIVGITFHNRVDVPFGDRLETPYLDEYFLKNNPIYSEDEVQTLLNFQYFFTYNKLYKFRNLKRFNFIEKLLKDKKIKTYLWHVTEIVSKNEFQKICTDTNYETSDAHFSFNGHRDFANMLYKKIVNPTLI
jgi:hypothetical protein